jgi:site-specific DNA-cytosine methylase
MEEADMKHILIAFERSGRAREAFANRYPDVSVTSVDLYPSEIKCSSNAQHWKCDIKEAMSFNGFDNGKWDLVVAFIPCDHLAVSGARWFEEKRKDGRQRAAIEMFLYIAEYPVDHIAIENPVGIMSGDCGYIKEWFPDLYERVKALPKPQIIQPWQFGDTDNKSTCLWLKNLPELEPTKIIDKKYRRNGVHGMSPGPNRSRDRARTYPGIAKAMAEQWPHNGRIMP